jgi:hypothetical protein
MADEYEVGYRKPPKSGQFKPGQSGNPRGRKKGRRGLRSILKEVLDQPVQVTQGGKKKSIPAQEALLQAITVSGVKGDL